MKLATGVTGTWGGMSDLSDGCTGGLCNNVIGWGGGWGVWCLEGCGDGVSLLTTWWDDAWLERSNAKLQVVLFLLYFPEKLEIYKCGVGLWLATRVRKFKILANCCHSYYFNKDKRVLLYLCTWAEDVFRDLQRGAHAARLHFFSIIYTHVSLHVFSDIIPCTICEFAEVERMRTWSYESIWRSEDFTEWILKSTFNHYKCYCRCIKQCNGRLLDREWLTLYNKKMCCQHKKIQFKLCNYNHQIKNKQIGYRYITQNIIINYKEFKQ